MRNFKYLFLVLSVFALRGLEINKFILIFIPNKLIKIKIPTFNFFVIFVFLISQGTYAAVLNNNPPTETNTKFNQNARVSNNFLFPDSPDQRSLNQCVDGTSYLNYNGTDSAADLCSSCCGVSSGCNMVEPWKIVISPDGKVFSSTTPNVDEGQNLFDSWSKTTLYNSYGQKVGSIRDVSTKLVVDGQVLLFENKASNLIGVIRAIWSSIGNQNVALAQPVELIELAVFEPPDVSLSDCELAVDCMLKALVGALFPDIGICKFVGTCSDACKDIKQNLDEILKVVFEGECSSVAAIIGAIITDGSSLIGWALITTAGCVIGCVEPAKEVNLKTICDDISKAEGAVDEAVCLRSDEATGVSIKQGIATEVGQKSGSSQLSISGEFSFEGEIDLTDSNIRIDDLLNEIQGAEELVKENAEVEESVLLPITLLPMDTNTVSTTAKSATVIYETPDDVTPSFRMSIEKNDTTNDLFLFTLDVNDASIPISPVLCNGDPPTTELLTSFTVDDNFNTPLRVTAMESWRCDTLEPQKLSIGISQQDGGGGCSLASPGTKFEFPMFILLILLPLFLRLRKLVKRL